MIAYKMASTRMNAMPAKCGVHSERHTVYAEDVKQFKKTIRRWMWGIRGIQMALVVIFLSPSGRRPACQKSHTAITRNEMPFGNMQNCGSLAANTRCCYTSKYTQMMWQNEFNARIHTYVLRPSRHTIVHCTSTYVCNILLVCGGHRRILIPNRHSARIL